jgi:hypothetical protein
VEQKVEGEMIIYTDCRVLVDLTIAELKNRLTMARKIKEKKQLKREIKRIRKSRALPFINLAKKLASTNNLDLQIK